MSNTTCCPKCEGNGTIPMFGAVADGVCFRCHGDGVIRVPFASFLKECKSKDLMAKVYWLLVVSPETIDGLPMEKMDAIKEFCSTSEMRYGRYDFVYGTWVEKFAAVYAAKEVCIYAAMPKPF